MGDIVSQATTATDQMIQGNIRREVLEQTDQVEQEFGVTDASLFQESVESTRALPAELQRAGTSLERLQAAVASGSLRESHYYARLDAMTRQLRARYPGYRDEVDAMVSKVTGVQTANALRRTMWNEWQASGSAKQDSREKLIEKMASDGTLPAGYQNMDYPTLLERHAGINADRAITQDEKAKLELDATRGTSNQRQASQVAASEGSRIIGNILESGIDVASGGRGAIGLIQDLQNKQAKGQTLTPDESAQLSASIAQLQMRVETEADAYLNKPFDSDPTKNMLSVMGPDEARKWKEGLVAQVKQFERYVTDDKIGLLAANANLNKYRRDSNIVEITKKYPVYAVMEAVRQIGGEVAVNQMLSQVDNGMLKEQVMAVRDMVAIGLSSGHVPSLQKGLQDMKEAGVTEGKAYSQVIDLAVKGLSDPNAPQQMKENYAKALFGPENNGLLAGIEQKDRLAVFSKLVNPESVKALQELGKTNPELWNDYATWVSDKFTGLFRHEAQSLQSYVEDANSRVNISFDPSKSQFVATPQPVRQGTNPQQTRLLQADAQRRNEAALQAVGRMNLAIRSLTPVMEADGADVNENLSVLFEHMGIDLNADQSTWLGRMGTAIKGALEKNLPGTPKTEPTRRPTGEFVPFGDGTRSMVPEVTSELSDDFMVPVREEGVTQAFNFLAGAEGTTGSYNTVYGGGAAPLDQMTISEVIARGKAQARGNNVSSAQGRYQFMSYTLEDLVSKGVVGADELMTPEVQDRMAQALLERRGLKEWQEGKLSDDAFINNLAMEWASIPRADTGRSHYSGDRAGNKATVSIPAVRELLASLKKGGKKPNGSDTLISLAE